mmetsp:Transcript_14390/g.34167  ORF Transcript_14390/g.34167 Transcript_14390/m.34167 type:complete len:230 (-) Transcript_14390:1070-1759(-)
MHSIARRTRLSACSRSISELFSPCTRENAGSCAVSPTNTQRLADPQDASKTTRWRSAKQPASSPTIVVSRMVSGRSLRSLHADLADAVVHSIARAPATMRTLAACASRAAIAHTRIRRETSESRMDSADRYLRLTHDRARRAHPLPTRATYACAAPRSAVLQAGPTSLVPARYSGESRKRSSVPPALALAAATSRSSHAARCSARRDVRSGAGLKKRRSRHASPACSIC